MSQAHGVIELIKPAMVLGEALTVLRHGRYDGFFIDDVTKSGGYLQKPERMRNGALDGNPGSGREPLNPEDQEEMLT